MTTDEDRTCATLRIIFIAPIGTSTPAKRSIRATRASLASLSGMAIFSYLPICALIFDKAMLNGLSIDGHNKVSEGGVSYPAHDERFCRATA